MQHGEYKCVMALIDYTLLLKNVFSLGLLNTYQIQNITCTIA